MSGKNSTSIFLGIRFFIVRPPCIVAPFVGIFIHVAKEFDQFFLNLIKDPISRSAGANQISGIVIQKLKQALFIIQIMYLCQGKPCIVVFLPLCLS